MNWTVHAPAGKWISAAVNAAIDICGLAVMDVHDGYR